MAKAFRGGAKLEAYLANLASKVRNPGTLRVGFLEGATYPDGTPVALVAATNEFGKPDKGQPPRPFFREMIREKSPGWGPSLAKLLVSTDYDANAALRLMGEGIKGQLQSKITTYVGPALADLTIAAKGFDKQLINTSHMLNSVDFDVKT